MTSDDLSFFFFYKQKTAYEMRISDWSSDVCSSDLANAPHMPVHLGSMGESVRTILRQRTGDGRGIRRGDAYALNAPYDGGTHLPDITVIMPVFVEDADAPAFFVAARGPHADLGGIAPGSLPPARDRKATRQTS